MAASCHRAGALIFRARICFEIVLQVLVLAPVLALVLALVLAPVLALVLVPVLLLIRRSLPAWNALRPSLLR